MRAMDVIRVPADGVVNDRRHIVFAGGGTGGHLYPALAVAREWRRRVPDARVTFFGTDRRVDQAVLEGEECEFVPQSLPGFSRAPWRWPAMVAGLRASQLTCRRWMMAHRPALVVGSGGMSSLSAMLEARRIGAATVVFNPDALPGRANRFLARRVDQVLVQWKESLSRWPAGVPVLVTGCPVRAEFMDPCPAPGRAFGLEEGKRTLLITGASLGARSVNRAVMACMETLESRSGTWQVLHLTGEADYPEVRRAYLGRKVKAVVLAYTHEMAAALRCAELVVSRAGASTLAELTAVGRASILKPYPHHRDRHQHANAQILAAAGAAEVIEDRVDPGLNAGVLKSALESLMDDHVRREEMARRAAGLGSRDAVDRVMAALQAAMVHRFGPADGADESVMVFAERTR